VEAGVQNLSGGLDALVFVALHGGAEAGEIGTLAGQPLRFHGANPLDRLVLAARHPHSRMAQGLNLLKIAENGLLVVPQHPMGVMHAGSHAGVDPPSAAVRGERSVE
jgi:hypothetical protein